jgi:hypothetical protein
MQLVEIVEKNVRFHLNQDKTNQFIVTTVSKTTNQQETTVAEADLADAAEADMVEVETVDEEPADMVEIAVAVEDLEETDLQEKCTKQNVQIVEKNVKFHSNQTEKNQFIVTTVSKTTNQQETTVVAEDISNFYTNYSFKNY